MMCHSVVDCSQGLVKERFKRNLLAADATQSFLWFPDQAISTFVFILFIERPDPENPKKCNCGAHWPLSAKRSSARSTASQLPEFLFFRFRNPIISKEKEKRNLFRIPESKKKRYQQEVAPHLMDENDSGIVRLRQIPGHFLSIHRCGEPAAERGVTRRKSSRVPRAIHSLRHWAVSQKKRRNRRNLLPPNVREWMLFLSLPFTGARPFATLTAPLSCPK